MKILIKICGLVLLALLLAGCVSSGLSPAVPKEFKEIREARSSLKEIYKRGLGYAVEGKFEEAGNEFERALQAYPSNPRAQRYLKVIEMVLNQSITSEAAGKQVTKSLWEGGRGPHLGGAYRKGSPCSVSSSGKWLFT